jgi:hypothetical protein
VVGYPTAMADERTEKISDETRATDRRDAQAAHEADRSPTADEERKAEENRLDPQTAGHYEEMAERGANAKGEGRVP